MTARRTAVARVGCDDLVEQHAVVGGDVLDVGQVLQPALDLERRDAGLDQRAQVVGLIVVLHRQQVLVLGDRLALVVDQGVGQAAGLRAFAAIGAPPGVGMADVALARIGDTERAVHKILQRQRRRVSNFSHLFDAHFARQHDLREAGVFQEFCLGRIADVGLRRGVQLDRRQIEFKQAHVLDDQRVDAGFVQFPGQPAAAFEFRIVQDGIECNEDLGPETVGEVTQAPDLGDIVAGAVAGAEGGAADIDGIGAVLDGFDAEIGVLGRGEEFEGVLDSRHGGLSR